jgi:hypothetical protein
MQKPPNLWASWVFMVQHTGRTRRRLAPAPLSMTSGLWDDRSAFGECLGPTRALELPAYENLLR